jgi:hypothetical protein
MNVGELRQLLLLYRDNVEVVLATEGDKLSPIVAERGRVYGRDPENFKSVARNGDAPFYKNALILKPVK